LLAFEKCFLACSKDRICRLYNLLLGATCFKITD